MRHQEFLLVLTIQGVILLVGVVVGKLQQVKENALCWSLKTYLSGTVVHLARATICRFKMDYLLMVPQEGADVETIKTVG